MMHCSRIGVNRIATTMDSVHTITYGLSRSWWMVDTLSCCRVYAPPRVRHNVLTRSPAVKERAWDWSVASAPHYESLMRESTNIELIMAFPIKNKSSNHAVTRRRIMATETQRIALLSNSCPR